MQLRTLTSAAAGFGKAIAVIGDLDGITGGEIAIGAPNAVINNLRDTGSVFIVRGSATGPVSLDAAPQAALLVRINGAGLFNRFGASIAAMGDVDGDGNPDLAVGAPLADVTTLSGQNILSGRVYLFKGKDITSATTLASSTEFEGVVKNQQFGTSLAKSASGMLLYAGSIYTSGSTTVTKQGIRDFINRPDPDASPVLSKAMLQTAGTATHAGGTFWSAVDADYKTVRQWIAEGANSN